MSFPLRTRTRGRPGRNAGVTNVAAAPSFNPLTSWTTDPVHGVWASDPLWVPPADGGAVSSWRNGGSAYTTGGYIGADGLVLPGASTGPNGMQSTSNVNGGTGDQEMIWRVTATDYTPAAAMRLGPTGTGAIGPIVELHTSGVLRLWTAGSGSTIDSTVALSSVVSNGVPVWVKCDYRDSDRRVRFWYSLDAVTAPASVTWTQLGTDVTIGAEIAAGTTLVLIGGYAALVFSSPWNGTIHYARWGTAIGGGSLILDVDLAAATEGVSAVTPAVGPVLNVINSQNPIQVTGSKWPTYDASLAAFNDAAVVRFATDDVLAVDPANISQPYYLVVIGATAGGSGVERLVGVGTNTGYGLGDDATPDWTFSAGTAIAGGAPDANPHLFRATVNGASSALLVDETSIVASDAGATGLTVLALGAGVSTIGTYANYLNGSIAYAAVFDTDPTALPEWATFKAWVTSTYGITVA